MRAYFGAQRTDNLVISLLAKQEFAVPGGGRVNNSKNQWLFTESWGVDVSVSTPSCSTALVEEAVSVGALVRLLQFQGGSAHLVEVTWPRTHRRPVWAIADIGFPREATVVAVVRDDRWWSPGATPCSRSVDEVLLARHGRRRVGGAGTVRRRLSRPIPPLTRSRSRRATVKEPVACTFCGPNTPYDGCVRAAFFDLDKTVIAKAFDPPPSADRSVAAG